MNVMRSNFSVTLLHIDTSISTCVEAHSHFVVLEGEVVWLLTGHGDSGHSGASLLAAEPPGHLCVVLWRGHVGANFGTPTRFRARL